MYLFCISCKYIVATIKVPTLVWTKYYVILCTFFCTLVTFLILYYSLISFPYVHPLSPSSHISSQIFYCSTLSALPSQYHDNSRNDLGLSRGLAMAIKSIVGFPPIWLNNRHYSYVTFFVWQNSLVYGYCTARGHCSWRVGHVFI